jgi:hypothetical protein
VFDDDDPERLRQEQAEKAEREAELADQAGEEAEQATHERRSAKAAYLEEKLEEQQAADEAAEREP